MTPPRQLLEEAGTSKVHMVAWSVGGAMGGRGTLQEDATFRPHLQVVVGITRSMFIKTYLTMALNEVTLLCVR